MGKLSYVDITFTSENPFHLYPFFFLIEIEIMYRAVYCEMPENAGYLSAIWPSSGATFGVQSLVIAVYDMNMIWHGNSNIKELLNRHPAR